MQLPCRLTTQHLLLPTLVDMELHGEWQRVAVLAGASLLPKAGGGGGRRLALAGRRPVTRCVPVHELVGRGDRLLGGRCRPRHVERSVVRST